MTAQNQRMSDTYICSRCKTVVEQGEDTVTKGYFAYCPTHDEDLYQVECELKQQKGVSSDGVLPNGNTLRFERSDSF